MKKIILGIIIGLILGVGVSSYAATAWKVELQKARIIVNGKYFTSKDKPPLSINGTTYLSVKDIGKALGFPVYYNGNVVIGYDAPPVVKSKIIPDKDVWKAGSLQITFMTNSYDPKRTDTTTSYAAINVEFKNISSTELNILTSNIYINPNIAHDFANAKGEAVSGFFLKPGEAIKGTLAFSSQGLVGPYKIKYSVDGKVYTFTYTNRAY